MPPVKIIRGGQLQDDVLKVILHNCRLPTWNYSDFHAIVAALRTAAARCIEICRRFGDDTFYSAMDAMLERNKRAMRELIRRTVPETKQVLRGLRLRRRHEHGPVQDRVHHVARGRQVHLRLRRHRSAVDLLDQLPAERGDVQDVRGRLHDHGVRPADPVQRRLLRPHGSAHPGRHAAEAAQARRALLPHARARPHLRRARRPARTGQPGVHVRRRLLRQPALHVLGLRQGRRVVPALPDRLRRHPRQAVRRRARRPLAVAVVHQRAERVPRELLSAAHRHLRDDHGFRRPREIPRRQRHPHRLPLPRAGRDLDPRRSLAHLSVGRERRTARRAQPEAPAARRRQRGAPAVEDRSREGRAGRPARCTRPGAAAAAATRSSASRRRSSSTSRRASSATRARAVTASC